MEGYRATGEVGYAQKIGEYDVKTFDEAVEMYIKDHPDIKKNCGPQRYTQNNFMSEEAFDNRRSDWNIWACALFNNEQDARKSFG